MCVFLARIKIAGKRKQNCADGKCLVSIVEFEVGSKELAALEEKVYVGSGRFVIEPGKPTIVEYKVSEVAA